MHPLVKNDFMNRQVLELGCGNGSLLVHTASWQPNYLEGIDLGDSVLSANQNMEKSGFKNYNIVKADLTTYRSKGFDIVYCIGVLHHLKNPIKGFQSVLANTKPGGKFHCWVYAREGNSLIVYLVDPLRKITSRLPWQITKHVISNLLGFLYFLYAHFIVKLRLHFLPLYEYSKWITKRNFLFFRHVVFDQLVTPQTIYIKKNEIESWLNSDTSIDRSSCYIIFRNGNSWKFGGTKTQK